MKKLVILFFLVPLLGNGQQLLPELMAGAPSSINVRQVENQIGVFVQNLKDQKKTSDVALLKSVFHQTQRRFLSSYVPYSDFTELFSSKKFDCLTATSLFSIVLDRLDFKYRIIETNYHIFLLVNTSKGEVLLETTDRFGGFVRSANEIQERIGSYRKAWDEKSENNKIYKYHFDLYEEVTPSHLPGLLYFNQAVKAYNTGSLEKCAALIVKARIICDTPRINEFSLVFLQTVSASKLEAPAKQRIFEQFKGLAQKPAILASR